MKGNHPGSWSSVLRTDRQRATMRSVGAALVAAVDIAMDAPLQRLDIIGELLVKIHIALECLLPRQHEAQGFLRRRNRGAVPLRTESRGRLCSGARGRAWALMDEPSTKMVVT